jgi:hypothetical protein
MLLTIKDIVMKTTTLFSATLIIIAQAALMAQAQPNRRILPVLGTQETTIHLSTSERILNDLKAKKNSPEIIKDYANKEAEKTDNNTFNYYNNPNCYSSLTWCNELNRQAEGLEKQELELYEMAKQYPSQKKQLSATAAQLHEQAQLIRIQASEISGKISLQKFKENKKLFHSLCENTFAGETILRAAAEREEFAEHQMKMAKDMREEAYAMPNNGSKLGSMNNAEEKEFIALKKQGEAIAVLKQYAQNGPALSNQVAGK